ncbi:MAG: PilN domain-containing protein [Candidatus Omnitrophota bacterium]|nr:MAG: PilN domain-containing protein [Candidatus Omnitrophota bacterium]
MKKIEVNLHPEGEKKEQKWFVYVKRYLPFMLFGLFLLVCVNVVLFLLASSFKKPRANLEKKWHDLTPQVQEITALKKEIDSLKHNRQEYRDLVTESISASQVFAELFDSIPKNIWFSTVDLGNGVLRMNGSVVRWKEDYLVSVNKLINSLNEKKYFSSVFKNINLKNSRKSSIAGVEIMTFSIDCTR